MKHRMAAGCVFYLWLGTFLLIIPAEFHLPYARTFVGYSLVMFAPMSWLTRSELYFVSDFSYWIGLVIMLAVSVLLVLIRGRTTRSVRMVGLVDLVVIAISVVVAVLISPAPIAG